MTDPSETTFRQGCALFTSVFLAGFAFALAVVWIVQHVSLTVQ